MGSFIDIVTAGAFGVSSMLAAGAVVDPNVSNLLGPQQFVPTDIAAPAAPLAVASLVGMVRDGYAVGHCLRRSRACPALSPGGSSRTPFEDRAARDPRPPLP